jgi:plasmid maintenance system antidote protein VapI
MIKQDPFFQRGLKKGKLEAKREDILKLHEKLNLTSKQIAEVLDLPENFVREILKENEKSS